MKLFKLKYDEFIKDYSLSYSFCIQYTKEDIESFLNCPSCIQKDFYTSPESDDQYLISLRLNLNYENI